MALCKKCRESTTAMNPMIVSHAHKAASFIHRPIRDDAIRKVCTPSICAGNGLDCPARRYAECWAASTLALGLVGPIRTPHSVEIIHPGVSYAASRMSTTYPSVGAPHQSRGERPRRRL